MDDPTETVTLLSRWRNGDADALAELLARDLEWVREFVHRRLSTPLRKVGDTDDIVQEATLNVLRAGPRFVVSDRDQFRALLATIVLNVLRTKHRIVTALKRDVGREQPLGTDTVLYLDAPQQRVEQPDRAVADDEQKEWLRLGLLLLAPDDQAVLDLHWQGLTDPEIGARLGLPANTARMRRARATARLANVVVKLKCGRVAELTEGE